MKTETPIQALIRLVDKLDILEHYSSTLDWEMGNARHTIKEYSKPIKPKKCKCDCPTGRCVTADFEHQICTTCGGLA